MAHRISKTFIAVATGIVDLMLVTIGAVAGVLTYGIFVTSQELGAVPGVAAGIIAGLIAGMPFWVASLVVRYRGM